MNYLLDTCVISELTKPEPSPVLRGWIAMVHPNALFLSVITIGEIRKGIVKLPDSRKKERLAAWLDTLIADYDDRILPVDLAVSERWGVLQAKRKKPERQCRRLTD